MSNAQVQALSH